MTRKESYLSNRQLIKEGQKYLSKQPNLKYYILLNRNKKQTNGESNDSKILRINSKPLSLNLKFTSNNPFIDSKDTNQNESDKTNDIPLDLESKNINPFIDYNSIQNESDKTNDKIIKNPFKPLLIDTKYIIQNQNQEPDVKISGTNVEVFTRNSIHDLMMKECLRYDLIREQKNPFQPQNIDSKQVFQNQIESSKSPDLIRESDYSNALNAINSNDQNSKDSLSFLFKQQNHYTHQNNTIYYQNNHSTSQFEQYQNENPKQNNENWISLENESKMKDYESMVEKSRIEQEEFLSEAEERFKSMSNIEPIHESLSDAIYPQNSVENSYSQFYHAIHSRTNRRRREINSIYQNQLDNHSINYSYNNDIYLQDIHELMQSSQSEEDQDRQSEDIQSDNENEDGDGSDESVRQQDEIEIDDFINDQMEIGLIKEISIGQKEQKDKIKEQNNECTICFMDLVNEQEDIKIESQLEEISRNMIMLSNEFMQLNDNQEENNKQQSHLENEHRQLSRKYDEEQMLIELECKHTFHLTCIKKWFKSKISCPLCRKKWMD